MDVGRCGLPTVGSAVALLRAHGHFVSELDHVTDEAGAAALLGCSRRTLRSWRDSGEGPPCFCTSRWLYSLDGLVRFAEAKTQRQLANRGNSGQFAIPGEAEDSE
jgi:hypothetical protein